MAAPGGPPPFRGPPPGPMEGMGPRPPQIGNSFPIPTGPYGRISSFGDDGEPPMKRMREGNGPPPMWGVPNGPGPRPPMQDPGKDRSMAAVFYKTRMCKNLAYPGGCPYHDKCNYAHSEEELRTLPPEYAAAVEGEAIEVKKHRPCKAFFTTGACQYGDKCYFSHDEAARPPSEPLERPPMPGPPGGVNFEPGGPPPGPGGLPPGPGGPPGPHDGFGGFGGPPRPPTPSQKPPNWKTKICTSWDRHGSCSYGDRCGFAHGPHELRAYGPVIEDGIKPGPGPGFLGGGPPFPGAGPPQFGGPPGPRPNGFPQEEPGKDLTLKPGFDSARLIGGSKAIFDVGPLVLTVDLDLIHGDSIFEEDLEDDSFDTGAADEKESRASEPEPVAQNPKTPDFHGGRHEGFEGFRGPPEGMPGGPWMPPGGFFWGGPGRGEGPPRGFPPFGPRGPGYHFGGPGDFGPPLGAFYGQFPRGPPNFDGPPNFEGGPPRMDRPGGWGGRGRGPPERGQFELEQQAG